MSVLVVEHLTKAFGGVKAVTDVSFALEGGEFLALIGPNGAGKTTCFNMLNGYLKPDSGSVRLDGTELVGLAPRKVWRLGVGRTFQITETFASMTVRENVQMALISHHHRTLAMLSRATRLYRDEAEALLARVGMADEAPRPAAELAYGDLKRLELAIALAHRPRVLLMDEPTAGMAPAERLSLMALTASIIRDEGLSVLFTEHDMDVVFNPTPTAFWCSIAAC
ncbi:MAG: ABC transporter ATP-binding protein [Acuticoccus sp.]